MDCLVLLHPIFFFSILTVKSYNTIVTMYVKVCNNNTIIILLCLEFFDRRKT